MLCLAQFFLYFGIIAKPNLIEQLLNGYLFLVSVLMLFVAPLQLIRDEIQAGKSDKEIYDTLREKHGETVLYEPTFDRQTAALWLSPVSLPVVLVFS